MGSLSYPGEVVVQYPVQSSMLTGYWIGFSSGKDSSPFGLGMTNKKGSEGQ